MLRALVVDDEAVARRRIRRLLAAEADMAMAGECADGASAVEAIVTGRPDLVFLDVQMPEMNGFDVIAAIDPASLPAVIFVTAHDDYALRAFEIHAIDYLLKPFPAERFRIAVTRARERIDARGRARDAAALAALVRERSRYLARVPVRSAGRIVMVDLSTVDWMEAADNYVRLHVGAKEYLLREALSTLEKRLDPLRFVRIHRSAIVQLDRVAGMRPATHGDCDLWLRDGTRLTLSRTWRLHARRALHDAIRAPE